MALDKDRLISDIENEYDTWKRSYVQKRLERGYYDYFDSPEGQCAEELEIATLNTLADEVRGGAYTI